MQNNVGFSLIQCITIITIIAIITTIAQPYYAIAKHQHLAKATIKTIQRCIYQARILAITKNTSVYVHLYKEPQLRLEIQKKDFKQNYLLDQNVRVAWFGFGDGYLKIYPNGMTDNNGHFEIQPFNKLKIYNLKFGKSLIAKSEI